MLVHTIERKREQMLETARVYGMSSSETLKCSQELDKLLQLHLANNIRERNLNKLKIS
ncbi:aspartyl-phosphate phosphatase Spo0E family protein [Bacillus sp. Marseille-Q3570]|uniref:aspartyl-phosphate phosphatase Spo0E family protein n=1 Tax=Bacillales TaxID=1385 RepID=UPI0021B743DC|nr:aspartyl-phosphate phosphatase Spo0E family protein [Bacillus sp. Marseille-Q3570]